MKVREPVHILAQRKEHVLAAVLCKFLKFKPLRALLEHCANNSRRLTALYCCWQCLYIGNLIVSGTVTLHRSGQDPSVDALRKETKGSQLLQQIAATTDSAA